MDNPIEAAQAAHLRTVTAITAQTPEMLKANWAHDEAMAKANNERLRIVGEDRKRRDWLTVLVCAGFIALAAVAAPQEQTWFAASGFALRFAAGRLSRTGKLPIQNPLK